MADLSIVSSSATKEVVMLTMGYMVILEAWLNMAIATPTPPISVAPTHPKKKKKRIHNDFSDVELIFINHMPFSI
jgi:hypothetical protein